eukprot:4116939-Prymnesium_polylepis.1
MGAPLYLLLYQVRDADRCITTQKARNTEQADHPASCRHSTYILPWSVRLRLELTRFMSGGRSGFDRAAGHGPQSLNEHTWDLVHHPLSCPRRTESRLAAAALRSHLARQRVRVHLA